MDFRWLVYSRSIVEGFTSRTEVAGAAGAVGLTDGRDFMIQRPRVLIVDNDAAFRGELMAILKRDCLAMGASGGMEGYTLALQYHPDVIVSEFHTPGWTGPRMLGQLRQHRILSRVPVIILTADNSRSAVQAALKAGANDYLLKTNISPELLLERIRKLTSPRAAQPATA